MESARGTCLRLRISVPEVVLYACDFLQAHGMRFMVDFGLVNAIDLAAEVLTYDLDMDDARR